MRHPLMKLRQVVHQEESSLKKIPFCIFEDFNMLGSAPTALPFFLQSVQDVLQQSLGSFISNCLSNFCSDWSRGSLTTLEEQCSGKRDWVFRPILTCVSLGSLKGGNQLKRICQGSRKVSSSFFVLFFLLSALQPQIAN